MSLVAQYVPTFMACQLQPVQPPNYIYLYPYLPTPTSIPIHIYVYSPKSVFAHISILNIKYLSLPHLSISIPYDAARLRSDHPKDGGDQQRWARLPCRRRTEPRRDEAIHPAVWQCGRVQHRSGRMLGQVTYPYYSGLEGHGLGGLKLKTQRNTHAATQWFKKKSVGCPNLISVTRYSHTWREKKQKKSQDLSLDRTPGPYITTACQALKS